MVFAFLLLAFNSSALPFCAVSPPYYVSARTALNTNCSLWLSAYNVTAPNSTNGVGVWNDSSAPNGIHFGTNNGTQATFPLYQNASGPNATPIITFDGVTNYMVLNASNGACMSSDLEQTTLFMVIKSTSGIANYSLGQGAVGGGSYETYSPFSDGKIYWDAGNQSTARISFSGDCNAWTLLTMYRSNGVMFIRTNGVLAVGTSGASATAANGNAPFYLGGSWSGSVLNSPLKGSIADLRIYPIALNTNQILAVERGLELRYGLPPR